MATKRKSPEALSYAKQERALEQILKRIPKITCEEMLRRIESALDTKLAKEVAK